MSRRINIVAVLVAFMLGLWLSPHEVQPTKAARPSLGALQAQIDDLMTQVDDVDSRLANVEGDYVTEAQVAAEYVAALNGYASDLDLESPKILASTATCDTASEGTLRYDSGKLQCCNGSEWVALTKIEVGSFGSSSASTTGELRFDTATLEFQVSDGSNWRTLAYE